MCVNRTRMNNYYYFFIIFIVFPTLTSAIVTKFPSTSDRTLFARGITLLGNNNSYHGSQDPTYERLVQIKVEWSEFEPTPGVYNIAWIVQRLDQIQRDGRHAIVKLQSNTKPIWLYNIVPYAPFKWCAENWDNKTAMYFHPTYISRQISVIKAFADFIMNHQQSVVYVRQSWCAIGEEWIGIPAKPQKVKALRNGSNWIVPPGCNQTCDPPPSWIQNKTDIDYQRKILDTYATKYRPLRNLLLRTNTPEELVKKYQSDIDASIFGWFHTGAGMEETQCFNQSHRYTHFRKDCLTGKTFCFAEMCGLPNIINKTQPENYTALEAGYWICLSNMHNGVSASGLHGGSVLTMKQRIDPRFSKAYNFADAYMGYHAHPDLSPGGWVALRGIGDGVPPYGDYNFFMTRNTIEDTSIGELQCGGDPEETPYGAWCRKLNCGDTLHFQLDQRVFSKVKKNHDHDHTSIYVMLRLVYMVSATADTTSLLTLWYDNGTPTGTKALVVSINESRSMDAKWREISVNVSDATFNHGGPHGSDIWLMHTTSNITANMKKIAPARVHMVEFRKIKFDIDR